MSSSLGRRGNWVRFIMIFTTGETDWAFLQAVFGTVVGDVEERQGSPAPSPGHSPEGHRQDPLHLDSPLQHLLHKALVWTLLDLFSSN